MKDKEFEELYIWANENNLPEYVLMSQKDKTPIAIFPRDKEVLFNLKKLDLNDWGLIDIHPLIGKLTNLKELQIGGNKFKELPEEICNLANLEILDMSYCKVKSLPKSIGKLKI